MTKFKLGNIEIGIGCPPIVIPEIGINHGGSLETAKAMVDAVAENGAKLIKHQTHIVEDEMCKVARNVIPGNSTQSIYDVMSSCALSNDEELELMRYTEQKGLLFLSTPFSRAAVDRLEKFGVSGYKVGSGELNNYPLVEYIASLGKPMIVSTGMNNILSVEKAVNIMERKNVPYALLHTTNLYPTAPRFVRLGAMQQMMDKFPCVPVGLSDHTLNNNACIAAIALGASIVERHFTDAKTRVGNDIVCSMDGKELKELLLAAAEVFAMRAGVKEPLPEEQITIDFAFATVVSIAPIKKGELLTEKNIWVKRPGTGEILAENYNIVIGKTAAADIEADIQLSKDMVKGF